MTTFWDAKSGAILPLAGVQSAPSGKVMLSPKSGGLVSAAAGLADPASYGYFDPQSGLVSGGTPTPTLKRALVPGDMIAFHGPSIYADENWYWNPGAACRRWDYRLFPTPYNHSRSGAQTIDFRDYKDGLIAGNYPVVCFGDDVNDAISGSPLPAADQIAALELTINEWCALSTSVLGVLITSRYSENGKSRRDIIDAINAYKASLHNTKINGVLMIYENSPYNVEIGGADAAYSQDNLHDNIQGAFFNRGQSLYNAVRPYLPAARFLPTPGVSPPGNKSPNFNFNGSGGAPSGTSASGTLPTGFSTSAINIAGVTYVFNSSVPGQLTVTASGTAASAQTPYINLPNITGLVRGRHYTQFVLHKVSAADGISPSTPLENFGITSTLGSTASGPVTGPGIIPTPVGPGIDPIDPVSEEEMAIGESWLVTRPKACPTSGSQGGGRLNLGIRAGPVDVKWVFYNWDVLEVPEPAGKPFYQAYQHGQARSSNIGREMIANVMGVYTVGGVFPTYQHGTTTPTRYTQAQANGTWIFMPGEWSGAWDSIDGIVDISTDGGATYAAPVIASLEAVNWTQSITGLVTGNIVRIRGTATKAGFTSTTATELVTIT